METGLFAFELISPHFIFAFGYSSYYQIDQIQCITKESKIIYIYIHIYKRWSFDGAEQI